MFLPLIIKIDIDAKRIFNRDKSLLILLFLLLNIIKGVVKNSKNLLLITSVINKNLKNVPDPQKNINP